jgi:hypothetical protein
MVTKPLPSPVHDYYDAATRALTSSQPVADDARSDRIVRNVLVRLLRELDARRPWAEPPYRVLDSGEFSELATAPTIGRIPMSRLNVGDHLNGIFEPAAGTHVNLLVLHLRSGEQVALLAPESFTEPLVVVKAHSAQQSTLDSLRELTGLAVEG